MEWRIRKNKFGEFVAEKGMMHKGGERIPGILGYTMPSFIEYESSTFSTKRKAENYIKQRLAKER